VIAYSVVKETINSVGNIRYFKEFIDAAAFCLDHNSDLRLYPRYYTEAIVIEEEYKETKNGPSK
jgi:hypothetical protein